MTKLCQVCYDSSAGTHFGVQVCSACTAFFRRTVAKNHKYRCKSNNTCEVLSTVRKMCKCCRYTKCLAVGMRKEGVQKFRDVYGKREAKAVESTTKPQFPILNELLKNYNHLESIRQVIHRDESKSVFTKKVARPLNYKESISVFLKEYNLVEDWILNSFSIFSTFPKDQKTVLLQNFYLQFVLLEGGHFACENNRSDITYLPSGDYIDCSNPESYYHDPDGLQPISAEDASKMFASSFGTYRRNVTHPMQKDQLDRFEFLALSALTLFDTGLEGQSDSSIEICRTMRTSIQRELLDYCMLMRSELDSSIRLGNMLSILLSRTRREFFYSDSLNSKRPSNSCRIIEL